MKNSVQLFLITSLCIATNISIAMELETPKKINKEKQAKIIGEITCIKDPFAAHYLTENRILIRAKNGCSIIDSTTNKEIKRIFDSTGSSSCIAIHPHKTKFALTAYHYSPNSTDMDDDEQQKITIYNAQTYEVEHTIDWNTIDGTAIEKIAFNPLEDTIATSGNGNIEVILYNYTTKNSTHINVPEARREHYEYNCPYDPIVAFHPTEPLMCLAWKTVYLHDLTASTNTTVIRAPHYHNFCEYTPNGSFIVTGTDYTISCSKPNHMPHYTITPRIYKNFDGDESGCFCKMAIHPNNTILTVFSRTPWGRYFINYYDLHASKMIVTTNLPLQIPHYTPVSFSPSGTKLLIIMNNTLMELKVPFKVLYKDITKKTFYYLLFLLKNYTRSCTDVEIPQDVNSLIGKILLETYKRR